MTFQRQNRLSIHHQDWAGPLRRLLMQLWHVHRHSCSHFRDNLWKTLQFSTRRFLCTNTLSFHRAGCQNVPAAEPPRQIPTLIFQPVTDSYTDRKVCLSSGITSLSLSRCLSPLFSFSLWIFRWSCKLVCSFHSSEETAPNITEAWWRLDNQHPVGPDGRPQEEVPNQWCSQEELRFFDPIKDYKIDESLLLSNTGNDTAAD